MIHFWLFGGLLVLLVTTVVFSALGARETEPDEEGGSPERRLEAAVAALREVEFDYRTGKLPEEEYRALREARGREALAARRELEALEGGAVGSAAVAAGGSAGAAASGGCGTCGADVEPDDRFCSECGAPVALRRR